MSDSDNIVFGKPFDEQRLHEAIEVCALGVDLDSMPSGVDTLVGDRGVMLSGGQKQRVSLARAVYANADVYIMVGCLWNGALALGDGVLTRCLVV